MNRPLFDDRRYPPTELARFVVDPTLCDACRKCVDTCPGQLLELRNDLPVNKHAQGQSALGCIGCKNCYAACPTGAIEIQGYYRVERGFYQTQLKPPSTPNPFHEAKAPAYAELEPRLTEVERVIYTRRSNRLFKK